jgi:eukaryotic-like serine/threonine-protein kinase
VQSQSGQQLGDYILEAELGRGSMGIVYRARHARQGGHFAVKVLLDALVTDQSFITRFTREARIIAALSHPNIIRVYGAGRQGQYLYFVMEYFRGVTAGHMLKERGRLPVGQAVEIAAQAADALAYAHAHGNLVHRDVKPENLLVDRWCRVKVLDFGLARVEGLQSITRIGTVVGSLYYVSPEQLLGQQIDGRSDVYALGVSLYEVLTGLRPYRGQSLSDMSKAILGGVAVPPSQIEPAVTPELERIIAKAMARDLDQRYADGADLCADLRAFQASVAAQSAQAGPPATANVPPAPPLLPAPPPAAPAVRGTVPPARNRRTLRPAALEPLPAHHHTDPHSGTGEPGTW